MHNLWKFWKNEQFDMSLLQNTDRKHEYTDLNKITYSFY